MTAATLASREDVKEWRTRPSRLSEDQLFDWLKAQFEAAQEARGIERRQQREDMAFEAGDQWSDEDKEYLRENGRVPIVFNRTKRILKAVAGVEINARQEIAFAARGASEGEVKLNETLSEVSNWMSDRANAEDAQSDAFWDAIVTGKGWTEQGISFEDEEDGSYTEECVSPLEMYVDHRSVKRNHEDAQIIFRARKRSARAVLEQFGGDDLGELHASFVDDMIGPDHDGRTREEKRRRIENSLGVDLDADVTIVHAEWIERVPFYRIKHPQTGEPVSLSEKEMREFDKLAKEAGAPKAKRVRLYRREFWQAYLGGKVLGGGARPALSQKGFRWQCVTCDQHPIKGYWYGLVRTMRDPQMWANKWLSKSAAILDTSASSGLLAEAGVFPDVEAAQVDYAKPGSITEVAEGALTKGRVQEKTSPGFPAGYGQLLEYATGSVMHVVGINDELMGSRDVNQPGVLEAQRKQAAMAILATLFNGLRRMRKQNARNRLYLIQEYFADGRLIRIADADAESGAKMVKLIPQAVAGEYDVEIDEAPTSQNEREKTWAMITTIFPAISSILTPETIITLLRYSPLPSKLIDELSKAVDEASQPNPAQQQLEAQSAQLAMAAQKADIEKTEAEAEATRAKAQAEGLSSMLNLLEAGIKGREAQAEAARAALEIAQAASEKEPAQPPKGRRERRLTLRGVESDGGAEGGSIEAIIDGESE